MTNTVIICVVLFFCYFCFALICLLLCCALLCFCFTLLCFWPSLYLSAIHLSSHLSSYLSIIHLSSFLSSSPLPTGTGTEDVALGNPCDTLLAEAIAGRVVKPVKGTPDDEEKPGADADVASAALALCAKTEPIAT